MINRFSLSISPESTRGTNVTTNPRFLPSTDLDLADHEKTETEITGGRGHDTLLGGQGMRLTEQRANHTINIEAHTETHTTKDGYYLLLKHIFGSSFTAQNATTGQYSHLFFPSPKVFDEPESELENQALSLNYNASRGDDVRRMAFVGMRPNGITFSQAVNPAELILQIPLMGFRRLASDTEVAFTGMPAENLLMSYQHLKIYTGTITPTGSAGQYTNFDISGATQILTVGANITCNRNHEDQRRTNGTIYPARTKHGKIAVEGSFEVDWQNPAGGFNAYDEFELSKGVSERELLFVWDTGTQAGTGQNHSMMVHIPRAFLASTKPSFAEDRDAMLPLNYVGQFDATHGYKIGILLKNTYSAA